MIAVKSALALLEPEREVLLVPEVIKEECPVLLKETREELRRASRLNLLLLLLLILLLGYELYRKVKGGGNGRSGSR